MGSDELNVISNNFFLGYTFIEFKDQANELLSTLQIYTLPDRFIKYIDLALKIVFQHNGKKDLLVIPLLDYSENPHGWLKDIHVLLNKLNPIKSDDKKIEILIAVTNKQSKIDWDPEIHEYIQLCLRSISLIHQCSIIYVKSNQRDQSTTELISFLLKLPIRINQKLKIEPRFVDDLLISKGTDTWGKIGTLSDIIDPEKESRNWDLDNANNKFIQNYESIVPLAKAERLTKNKQLDGTVQESVSLDQFLQNMYEKRAKNSIVASVLSR